MKTSLELYNSLTRKKEAFTSASGKVGVYVCGITPYDVTHIGHAFTYVSFDVIIRYLRYLGFSVTYVQNVTDIDDDILKRAKLSGRNWRELAEENTGSFLSDMRWLNHLQPDCLARATDHIKDIQQIIAKLIASKNAYTKDGSVYFDISSFPQYGQLSRLSKEEMLPIANQRGNNPDDPNKKNPLDFVLWQKMATGEPCWKSPWGDGRPGWHIECTAMGIKYLGTTIDINGGGSDLMFPHHESSIAQSESVTGQTFVRFWVHTAMVRYKGEKMSKSLGNMVFIKDLKKKYSPNVIRLLLLGHHYREAWDYDENELEGASEVNELFKRVWLMQSGESDVFDLSGFRDDFFGALNDDFNTPKAIEVLTLLSRTLIQSKDSCIADAKSLLNTAFNILGLVIEYE